MAETIWEHDQEVGGGHHSEWPEQAQEGGVGMSAYDRKPEAALGYITRGGKGGGSKKALKRTLGGERRSGLVGNREEGGGGKAYDRFRGKGGKKKRGVVSQRERLEKSQKAITMEGSCVNKDSARQR